jgi:hypothetical protein
LPSTVIAIDAMSLAEFAETATLTLPLIVDPSTGELIVTVGAVGGVGGVGGVGEVGGVGVLVPVLVVPLLVVLVAAAMVIV